MEEDFILDNEKGIEEAHKKVDELIIRFDKAFRQFLDRVENGRLVLCEGCASIFMKRELQRTLEDGRLLCAECCKKAR